MGQAEANVPSTLLSLHLARSAPPAASSATLTPTDASSKVNMVITAPSTGKSVFGYGSLIWKAPPFDLESKPGYIKGFVRRFAQKSHDHRGTPENPGRVVTLVSEADWKQHRKDDPLGSHHVWGRVYDIPPDRAEEIWAYLDVREKDGYSLRTVDVYSVNDKGNEVLVEQDVRVYVGETDNPSFGGGEEMASLASHIARTAGPSGPNKEYVYNLVAAIRNLDPHSEDQYLKELERLVRERDSERSNEVPPGLL